MDGRQRMINIMQGKPTDRVSWTTISDDITRADMPEEYKNIPILDFYRKIGCDILQFGPYGLPENAAPQEPFEIASGVSESYKVLEDGAFVHLRSFQGSSLSSVSKTGHPFRHPVSTARELKLLLEMTESYSVTPRDAGYLESCARCDGAIGGDGIYVPTFSPSPVQQLIEYECGVEGFYNLLADEPELMERVIDALFAVTLRKYEIMAEKSPFIAAIPVENTSTALISPKLYRKYSLPHMRAFSDVMHKYGKKAIIHMCGHVYHLLDSLKETDLDGIHALTTPPIGDCPFEAALDALGDDLIIIGGLDGTVFHSPYANAEDIRDCINKTLTPRIRNSNFILGIGTDGLRTDLWRISAVRDALEDMRR